MPLLWYLRDELKLTGTKFGCGMGLCGACTVHLNGEAVRSCVTPVSAVAGKKITTIEGLSPNASHPLQVAWEKHNVAQCGYCQPGQIMQAAALLQKTPKPTDAQIDNAMDGNSAAAGPTRGYEPPSRLPRGSNNHMKIVYGTSFPAPQTLTPGLHADGPSSPLVAAAGMLAAPKSVSEIGRLTREAYQALRRGQHRCRAPIRGSPWLPRRALLRRRPGLRRWRCGG